MKLEANIECELMFYCSHYPSLKCFNCVHNKRKFKIERNNVRTDHFQALNATCPTGKCEG